jgi:hypothetical protein
MNKKIRKMMRQIERRGGIVGISAAVPDDVAEQFLREILNCPDCAAEASRLTGATGDPLAAEPKSKEH